MTKKPIAIFRTKSEILAARDLGNVKLPQNIIEDPIFDNAKMQDTLGFKVLEGSDYEVVEVKTIQDDPEEFLELAFGRIVYSLQKKK